MDEQEETASNKGFSDEDEAILALVTAEDLVAYGLIPEFVGRLPVVTTLNPLDEEALVKILSVPEQSLVRQYQILFEMDGGSLEFTKDALRAIARKAMERKTGARGPAFYHGRIDARSHVRSPLAQRVESPLHHQ